MADADRDTCDWTELAVVTDRCAYVIENCDGDSLMNFYHLYYCSLD